MEALPRPVGQLQLKPRVIFVKGLLSIVYLAVLLRLKPIEGVY